MFQQNIKDGQAREQAWNNATVYMMKAAKVEHHVLAQLNCFLKYDKEY